MAVLPAKGERPLDQDFRHQGILGTIFTGRLVECAQVGDTQAVVPTISGRSWICGFNTLVLAPDDPLPNGYDGQYRGLRDVGRIAHPAPFLVNALPYPGRPRARC